MLLAADRRFRSVDDEDVEEVPPAPTSIPFAGAISGLSLDRKKPCPLAKTPGVDRDRESCELFVPVSLLVPEFEPRRSADERTKENPSGDSSLCLWFPAREVCRLAALC